MYKFINILHVRKQYLAAQHFTEVTCLNECILEVVLNHV